MRSRADETHQAHSPARFGFAFRSPYTKARTAIALPVFALIAERKGFVFRFPTGEHLSLAGDIPFVSDSTMVKYAKAMRDETFEVGEFIGQSPRATAAREAFWRDCVYLSRYRALLELFVRALLEPASALPLGLAECDFPQGQAPALRTSDTALDVPRAHALLLWARAGKDPLALADFLHEQLLDLELNRLPKNASLQSELATLVRRRQTQLLADVQARISQARASSALPADFEREFSPAAQYLDPSGAPSLQALVHSYQTSQAPVAETIRAAAYEVVLAELGVK